MIIDTSALVAMARREPDEAAFAEAIDAAPVRRMSAATYLEVAAVIDRGDAVASRKFDEIVRSVGIRIEPVTAAQAEIARAAYRDFGRGSGHPARLNFGDCFPYALAKDLDEPLLFKGNDFGHTDVRSALAG